MTLQAITYRGRTVAAATSARFFLSDELDERQMEDPERTFVIYMCAYAMDVLSGVLPGPYTEDDARHYARAALIPFEIAERPGIDVERASRALRVPADELRAEQAETAT